MFDVERRSRSRSVRIAAEFEWKMLNRKMDSRGRVRETLLVRTREEISQSNSLSASELLFFLRRLQNLEGT